MTGIDADEVRLAPRGNVYLADTGTALPTTATMALNASFKSVGYVSEEGINLGPKVKLDDIMAWQATSAIKQALDTVDLTLKFSMIQVNSTTWGFYFFNETFVNNFGEAKLTITSSPPSQEVSLILEWIDDEEDQSRLVVPRASLSDRDNLVLNRKKEQATGVTIKCLDNSGVLAYLYSENPDLVPST